jgi:hypothetical protein
MRIGRISAGVLYVYSLMLRPSMKVPANIVTCRPVSERRPKYAYVTIEKILEEVFSMWSAPCPVLGNGPMNTQSNNRRCVFYVVRAMPRTG